MTQTLRRELRLKFFEILSRYLDNVIIPESNANEMVDQLADVAFELLRSKPVVDLKNSDPAWSILAGVEISEDALRELEVSNDATDSFERELHFNPLPWNSNREWEKFYKFVVDEFKKNPEVWHRYNNWRDEEGKYKGAMTNPKIYAKPSEFMAASFPAFLAHTAMYAKPKQDGGSGYYA